MIDANVPFLLVNPAKWNTKKPVLAMEKNPDFARDVERALVKKGLDKTAPIILMCRSGGTRGAPSAKALEGMGFKNVYVVTDGFEGSSSKANPDSPWRNVSGWKNSGLPWSYKLNTNKVYLRP
jgi:rhodanese-related sulfurtransferase